jgi:hypothetical protein
VIEDDLGFKVVKDLGAHDELLARAATLPIARGAFQAAVKMFRARCCARAPASWNGAKPMMHEYPVRCCCQPRKLFGWLQLKAGRRDGSTVRVMMIQRNRVFDPPTAAIVEIKSRPFPPSRPRC